MVIPKVQQYNSKKHYPAFTIYALCKGLNSGKPLEKPCPNCFAILCQDEQQREFYKSLLYGLWISKAFHQVLVGSVIEFIRINDFKKLVAETAKRLQMKQADFENDLKKIRSYEQLERQYLSQAALLDISLHSIPLISVHSIPLISVQRVPLFASGLRRT